MAPDFKGHTPPSQTFTTAHPEHDIYTDLIYRDMYRVKSGQDEKWQDVHLGLIEDVWKTRKLKMGKQATINILIWDKGWH